MTTEPPLDDDTVTELRAWHCAREQAARHNRNLLQYAAGIATVLGITAGSSSVFAIAGSLQSADVSGWYETILGVVVFISVIALMVLGTMLFRTFGARRDAEREVDTHLAFLVGRWPDRFLPKAVDLNR
ncbi:MAG: hypothetical protein WEE64_00170 [Dehalococcoidia bacterium]